MARLKEIYRNEIAPKLQEDLKLANVMEIPRITKITLNMGLGEAIGDKKVIEHAVADLLERTRGMPRLDDRGPGPRADDVDREEVVVDHDHPRRRQVVPGDHRLPGGGEAPAQPARRAMRQHHDRDGGMPSGQVVTDRRQVAAERRRVGGGEQDPGAKPPSPRQPERQPDERNPDGEDETAHRGRISWSMTRSVDPPSRCAKWRAAKAGTLAAS